MNKGSNWIYQCIANCQLIKSMRIMVFILEREKVAAQPLYQDQLAIQMVACPNQARISHLNL